MSAQQSCAFCICCGKSVPPLTNLLFLGPGQLAGPFCDKCLDGIYIHIIQQGGNSDERKTFQSCFPDSEV